MPHAFETKHISSQVADPRIVIHIESEIAFPVEVLLTDGQSDVVGKLCGDIVTLPCNPILTAVFRTIYSQTSNKVLGLVDALF